MKKVIIIIFKILFIILTIVLIPVSYLWGFTHEQILFVNDANKSELEGILNYESNDRNKEVKTIICNDRWDYYAITIYYSDGSESKDSVGLEYEEFNEFMANNAISGFVIATMIDLLFIGMSIFIIIRTKYNSCKEKIKI